MAPGQAPASDTGNLVSQMQVKSTILVVPSGAKLFKVSQNLVQCNRKVDQNTTKLTSIKLFKLIKVNKMK